MNDVEFMVNNNADVRRYAIRRAAALKKKRQLQRMLLCIGALAATAICGVILGTIGAVHSVLAAVISVMSVMTACFTLGMYAAKVIRK